MKNPNPEMMRVPRRQDLRIERVLHALGDFNRIKIVHLIATADREWPGGRLAEQLAVRKPTLSHHLGILRACGLMEIRIVGNQKLNRLRRRDLNAQFPGRLVAILRAKCGISVEK